jgi:hypothetical protein
MPCEAWDVVQLRRVEDMLMGAKGKHMQTSCLPFNSHGLRATLR